MSCFSQDTLSIADLQARTTFPGRTRSSKLGERADESATVTLYQTVSQWCWKEIEWAVAITAHDAHPVCVGGL